VKDGCPFLAPSFGQAKEGDTNKRISFYYVHFLSAYEPADDYQHTKIADD